MGWKARSAACDLRAVAQRGGALDDVLELAHVAGPVMFRQAGQRLGAEGKRRRVAPIAGHLLGELPGKQRDVLFSILQRRQVYLDDAESEVQVLPELSCFHHGPQVPIGRRDDPHVRLDDPVAADTLQLVGLQNPEQLRLHGQLELADLVQEDGAAIRLFKAALVLGLGAGEGPLLVPEENRLHQLFRDRAAVLDHERLVRPAGEVVDGVGDPLLAGAGLPLDVGR